MEYSKGDLVDKQIILQLKYNNGLEEVEKELKAYNEEVYKFVDDIRDLYEDLRIANKHVWIYEDAIGQTEDIEHIGQCAISIGKWNGKRIALKNKINEVLKSGFKEYKTENHRSYETAKGEDK